MATPRFRVGDRVSFLDEVGGGIVVELLGATHVRVRTPEGFELGRSVRDLVLAEKVPYTISDHQAGMVAANDVLAERMRRKLAGCPARAGKTPRKQEDQGVAEVDLHLHEIVDDEASLQPEERLSYQLAYFERSLEAAIRDGKRKLIVIHGVGEGVLREEVRRILQYYDGVQFHDADMRRYGTGATEVLIMRHR
jgi:hypothetical protein